MSDKAKMVMVTWFDITGSSEADSLKEVLDKPVTEYKTLGFLLSEANGVIRLCSSKLTEHSSYELKESGRFRDILLIPQEVIKSIVSLFEGGNYEHKGNKA